MTTPAVDDSAAEWGVTESKATVNNVEINYVRVGSGPTNILCIPGTLGYWVDFAPLFAKFAADEYSVVVFDPPGYGKSIPPERKYTMTTNLQDGKIGHEIMKQLDLLPFSILGWSEGMRAATLCATQFPGDVTHVISWGGAAYIVDYHVKYFTRLRDVDQWPDSDNKTRLVRKYGLSYLKKTWAAQSDFYITVLQAVPNGNLIFDQLPRVRCPYLLIQCGKDPMAGENLRPQYEQIVKKIKHAKMIEKADGLHDVHLQHTDWFVDTVKEFLKTPPPAK